MYPEIDLYIYMLKNSKNQNLNKWVTEVQKDKK